MRMKKSHQIPSTTGDKMSTYKSIAFIYTQVHEIKQRQANWMQQRSSVQKQGEVNGQRSGGSSVSTRPDRNNKKVGGAKNAVEKKPGECDRYS